MSKHANISVFVPHIGCSHRCSFCNQNSITGQVSAATKEDVINAVETAMKSKNYSPNTTEIAFFGGSFTAIDRNYMISLLETAYHYVKLKVVKGIRISTRPDAIDTDILSLLKKYGVTAIELGAQSTDNTVLEANNRGHLKEDIFNASFLITKHGFSLGLQMMTGLYKSNNETDIKTAEDFCLLKPDTVRIYPTVVLESTYLAYLYKNGEYTPQSISDAAELCSYLLELFDRNNINVIRLGLHSINEDSFVAGPWHPSFSELCWNRIYYKKILNELKDKANYTVFVAKGEISKAVGQNRVNLINLKEQGFTCKIKEDDSLLPKEIKIIKDV